MNTYPLLRNRIYCLNQTFKSGKAIGALINKHEQKTSWHIHRIYRARNCIIHDGEQIPNIECLVENLHSYIDVLCNGLIRLLNETHHTKSVIDGIYEMRIKVKLYDSFINNNNPTKDNIARFLYP